MVHFSEPLWPSLRVKNVWLLIRTWPPSIFSNDVNRYLTELYVFSWLFFLKISTNLMSYFLKKIPSSRKLQLVFHVPRRSTCISSLGAPCSWLYRGWMILSMLAKAIFSWAGAHWFLCGDVEPRSVEGVWICWTSSAADHFDKELYQPVLQSPVTKDSRYDQFFLRPIVILAFSPVPHTLYNCWVRPVGRGNPNLDMKPKFGHSRIFQPTPKECIERDFIVLSPTN